MFVPFAHWVRPGRLRTWLAETTYRLGKDYHRDTGKNAQEWAKVQLDWFDHYCHYLWYRDLRKMLAPDFVVSHNEIDYCRFRARNSRKLSAILGVRPLRGIYERLFRRVAFIVIQLRKKPTAQFAIPTHSAVASHGISPSTQQTVDNDSPAPK